MDAGSLERPPCKKRNGKGQEGKEKEEEEELIKSFNYSNHHFILI